MCARVGVVHVAVHTCVYVETWTHQREGSRRLQKLCRPGKRHCLISSFFKLARRGEKNKPLFIPPCLPVCPFTSVSSVGLYTSLIFFLENLFFHSSLPPSRCSSSSSSFLSFLFQGGIRLYGLTHHSCVHLKWPPRSLSVNNTERHSSSSSSSLRSLSLYLYCIRLDEKQSKRKTGSVRVSEGNRENKRRRRGTST